MADDRFRAFSFGRQVGGVMDRDELVTFEASLAANCAAGLADLLEAEVVIERRDPDGTWSVDHVLNGGDSADLFSNPNGHDG